MKGLLLLVVMLTCASPLEAIEPNQGNLSGLAEAYGFVLGQKKEFPSSIQILPGRPCWQSSPSKEHLVIFMAS